MRRLDLHFGGVDSSLKEQEEARFALSKAGSGQSMAVAPESDGALVGSSEAEKENTMWRSIAGDIDASQRTLLSEKRELAALRASHDELLEALKMLLADIEDYQRINHLGGENNHSQVVSRAAIKKAEAIKKDLGK